MKLNSEVTGADSTNILNSLSENELQKAQLSVSERYYEHKYCMEINPNIKNVHQRVSFHSNRICLISLAENHPVIKNNKKVTRINCEVDEKTDRLKNAASGKGKRGAQKLSPDSVLCYVECSDGSNFPIYSCIKGKLVEINDNLVTDASLLVKKPMAEGYIALLLPVLSCYEDIRSSMLTKEQYFNYCDN